LLPLLKRFRPITLAAGALALTFGAGVLVGFLFQFESEQPPVQVVTTRPEPVRPTAPRIELPRVEPPRVQDQDRAEEEASPPPSPQPSPPVIVPPLPKPTPPTVLAVMLPPPGSSQHGTGSDGSGITALAEERAALRAAIKRTDDRHRDR